MKYSLKVPKKPISYQQTALCPDSKSLSYWLSGLRKQGISPHHPSAASYSVYRDVKEYGAQGDGITDDTEAINLAISDGKRCGDGHPGNDSSTISPALVYFPPGIYQISRPIISYCNTSLVGDATNRPVIRADKTFRGSALIDENPYSKAGRNWYTPENNSFRSVAHLIVDVTQVDGSKECSGIHHQVAQATGVRHVHFELRPWSIDSQEPGQRGISMENGSGSHLSDLTFRGGKEGMWVGNKNFTIQRCRFDRCFAAISQHWNWSFMYNRIEINECHVGLEMRVEAIDGAAASVVCADWEVTSTSLALNIVGPKVPSRGSLVLSNVRTTQVPTIVARSVREWQSPKSGSGLIVLVSPGLEERETVTDWTWQGDSPSKSPSMPRTGSLLLSRPCRMVDSNMHWLHRPRPEYDDLAIGDFISLRDEGAVGDGAADDTSAFQGAVEKAAAQAKVLYIPHGHYLLTSTVVIPPGCRIVGEVWPVFLGTGPHFSDEDKPRPVIQVGQFDGQEGLVEISECVFSTKGPCKGAIVLQWQLQGVANHENNDDDDDGLPLSGMWDTHVRLGGFLGSDLESERFDSDRPLDLVKGWACFLALHLTPRSSGCFVNNWVWLADHLLDTTSPSRHAGKRISLLASRGILIESNPGPVMLWGGASEHFLLYQYQLKKAKNILIALGQTESPYFLGKTCLLPQEIVRAKAEWSDPIWEATTAGHNHAFKSRSWGMRILNSTSIHLFGACFYSFYDSYSQDKLHDRRCQEAVLSIEGRGDDIRTDSAVNIVGLNTIGTKNMLVIDGKEVIDEEQFRNGLVNTLGYYFSS